MSTVWMYMFTYLYTYLYKYYIHDSNANIEHAHWRDANQQTLSGLHRNLNVGKSLQPLEDNNPLL